MNVAAHVGALASAAGTALAQTGGAETERSQRDAAVRERTIDGHNQSEKAAGVGTTDADQGADDRDADGRRLWEAPQQKTKSADPAEAEPERRVKDPTGVSGTALDLTG
ncbi:MAG TPA: hypothetical protein VEQ85_13700 [Lacipirellulaceae bacterium]|nr:hypothetical protein [Lacipirellulaceae bacterium]